MIVDRSRIKFAWQFDHHRHANSAFGNATLAAAQWMIASNGGDVFLAGGIRFLQTAMNVATVVGVENDDGFIGNTLVIKCIE